jgi:hypothetical protein
MRRGALVTPSGIHITLHLHRASGRDGKPSWDVDLRPDSPPCELRLPK